MVAGLYHDNSATTSGADFEYYEVLVVAAMFDRPGVTHHTRTSWQGTKEVVEFIRVDEDGFMTTTSQIWHRTAKEHRGPVQGPPKSLRFLTADRCDHNRGRHWDRKIA